MKIYTKPSRSDYFDFLIKCYLGRGDDRIALCVHRAYLDFRRTLHGFGKRDDAQLLRSQAHSYTTKLIGTLPEQKIFSQEEFDAWHQRACEQLKALYHRHGFRDFHIGQGQKWLNMSLKYIFALGEDRIPGFSPLYQYAHIPLDNIFNQAAIPLGGPKLTVAWSRLDDYNQYSKYQKTYRNLFAGSAPLAAEFQLWISASRDD